jgi:putative nucleotidyltransferase with HDIG domain
MTITFDSFPELFARITQAVHQKDDLDALLHDVLQEIASSLGAIGCTLRMLDLADGLLRLRAAVGLSRHYLEKGEIVADPNISEVFEEEPVIITDAANDPRIQYPSSARREGIASVVGLPFPILDNTRMVLRVYFKRTILPDQLTISWLKALAGQGALAIRNALLHQRYVVTFREISSAIHSGRELTDVLQRIVEQVAVLTAAKGCIYWILDTQTRVIVNRVVHGFDYRGLSRVDYTTVEELFAPTKGKQVIIDDARNDGRIPNLERLGKKRVQTVLGLPFQITPPYVGVMAVYFAGNKVFKASEIDFLTALGEQGAIALQKAFWFDESRLKSFQQTVEGLVVALEAKDGQTHGHSLRVAHLARLTAQTLGLPEREIETIYRAGMLHDIGKIGTEDHVLARLGRLDPSEADHIREHPEIGARILAPMADGASLIPMVRHHHERYDGQGYPDGCMGDNIPLGARILTVCDVLDSMLHGRAAQPKMSVAQAMEELRQGRYRHFDPQVADAAICVLTERPGDITPPESSKSILSRLRGKFFKGDNFTKDPFAKIIG